MSLATLIAFFAEGANVSWVQNLGYAAWAQAFGTWLSLAVIYVGLKTIASQNRNSVNEKRVDALIVCNNRYAEYLSKFDEYKKSVNSGVKNRSQGHVERIFWSVQFEQWQYFQLKVLQCEEMIVWAKVRYKQFLFNDEIAEQCIRESWIQNQPYFSHVESFDKFIRRLKNYANENAQSVSERKIWAYQLDDTEKSRIRDIVLSCGPKRRGRLFFEPKRTAIQV